MRTNPSAPASQPAWVPAQANKHRNMPGSANTPHAILRFPDVKSLTGYSRSTIYRCIGQGLFTQPVRLGARAVGWPSGEIAALNAARIAGQSDDGIRALVEQLHAVRTAN